VKIAELDFATMRWRIELRLPGFSGEDSLASNKAGAFLP
jgi:hypothetical protein